MEASNISARALNEKVPSKFESSGSSSGSVSFGAMPAYALWGNAAVTRPAPQRRAPLTARHAAPVILMLPQTHSAWP